MSNSFEGPGGEASEPPEREGGQQQQQQAGEREGGEREDRSYILAHFQEITGLEDEERSLSVLREHQWNLETAVQDVLNEHDGLSPVFNEVQPLPLTTPTSTNNPHSPLSSTSQHTPSPAQSSSHVLPRQQSWWAWLVNVAFFPIRFVVTSASDVLQFVVSLLFGFQPTPARNPRGDVMKFVSEFQAQYGQTHPPFLLSSYSQALDTAKQDLKFLLIYLHSPTHPNTPPFCRNILASRNFVDFLREASVLVWGVSVETEEGVRVSHVMRETSYPFLALVVQRGGGGGGGGGRMVVVERVEGGVVPLGELLPRLQRAMGQNESGLLEERRERERRTMDQRIRQEQDRAYQDSLRADREKQRQREERRRREEEEAREEVERALRLSRKEEELAMRRRACLDRLPPEPPSSSSSSSLSPSPGGAGTLSVVLRMPGGERVERRFLTSDLLQSVYDFAYSSEQVPNHFSLVMGYPRKELRCEEGGGPALGTLGLGPKCALFVQEEEEEGEGEGEM